MKPGMKLSTFDWLKNCLLWCTSQQKEVLLENWLPLFTIENSHKNKTKNPSSTKGWGNWSGLETVKDFIKGQLISECLFNVLKTL